MRSLLTWLAILGYGVLALGLPLPAGMRSGGAIPAIDATGLIAAKDRSVPFPCMNSPCGCASAEQCFRECCCTTVGERLAFARRHRLDADLIASLEARMKGDAELAERKPRKSSCCSGDRAATNCCTSQESPGVAEAAAPESCCDAPPASDSGNACPAPAVAEGRPRLVTLQAMLACKGIVASWVAVAGAPPTPRFEITGLLPPRDWVELLDVAGESPLLVPVPPPPKVA